ncbi:MAG: hypothetical protein WBB08_00265 [Halobacteriota archaeon]
MSEEFVIPKDYKPKGRLTKKIWGSFLKSVPELLEDMERERIESQNHVFFWRKHQSGFEAVENIMYK